MGDSMDTNAEIAAIKQVLDAHVRKMQALEETVRFLAQILIEEGVLDRERLVARAYKAAPPQLAPASEHRGVQEPLARKLAHGTPFPQAD